MGYYFQSIIFEFIMPYILIVFIRFILIVFINFEPDFKYIKWKSITNNLFILELIITLIHQSKYYEIIMIYLNKN